jgi:hypothetical protein
MSSGQAIRGALLRLNVDQILAPDFVFDQTHGEDRYPVPYILQKYDEEEKGENFGFLNV